MTRSRRPPMIETLNSLPGRNDCTNTGCLYSRRITRILSRRAFFVWTNESRSSPMPACSWLAWTISGKGQTRRFLVAEALEAVRCRRWIQFQPLAAGWRSCICSASARGPGGEPVIGKPIIRTKADSRIS